MIVLKDDITIAEMVSTFVMAVLGSYISANLAEHYRVSKKMRSKIMGYRTLLLLMAITLGGVGIWTVHFTIISSSFYDENGIEVKKSFGIGVSVASIIIAIFSTFCGLLLASRDRAFSKSKCEIATMVMEDARYLSIEQIRKSGSLVYLVLLKDLTPLILGGVINGTGIIVMYFVGMMAVDWPGYYIVNPGIAAGAAFIPLIGSPASFWILFRFLAVYPDKEMFRLLSSTIMALSICGCHYSSHLSITYVLDPLRDTQRLDQSTTLSPNTDAFYIGFVVVMAFLWIMVILIFTDLRSNFYDRLQQIAKVDALVKSTIDISISSNCDLFSMKAFKEKYYEINDQSAWYHPLLAGKNPPPFRLQLIGVISRSGKRVNTSFGPRPVGEFMADVEQGNMPQAFNMRSFRKVGVLGSVPDESTNLTTGGISSLFRTSVQSASLSIQYISLPFKSRVMQRPKSLEESRIPHPCDYSRPASTGPTGPMLEKLEKSRESSLNLKASSLSPNVSPNLSSSYSPRLSPSFSPNNSQMNSLNPHEVLKSLEEQNSPDSSTLSEGFVTESCTTVPTVRPPSPTISHSNSGDRSA